ncbi:MAG: ROK family protein [Candidatus Poribacteria bacterium]|nr:ROK family protein [Candidatus Poribacteria bacterium]
METATQSGLERLGREEFVVGVDLGGTKILAAIIGSNGKIVSRFKAMTRADKSAEEVIGRIADCVSESIKKANLDRTQVRAIGIGAPGVIDSNTGVVIYAPNLRWTDVALKAALENQSEIPVTVDNDVNLGTLGEQALGAGRGVDNLVGIFVGTGIGGGIILNGKLFYGANRTAGEIGHVILKPDGPKCSCGNRGCLEALASRTAISRHVQKAITKQGKKSILPELNGGSLDLVRSRALAKAVERGDKVTLKAIQRAQYYLGVGVATVTGIVNPQVVVLGGGLIEAMGKDFVAGVYNVAAELALPNAMNGVDVLSAELGDDAGVIGAAVLACENLGSA